MTAKEKQNFFSKEKNLLLPFFLISLFPCNYNHPKHVYEERCFHRLIIAFVALHYHVYDYHLSSLIWNHPFALLQYLHTFFVTPVIHILLVRLHRPEELLQIYSLQQSPSFHQPPS
uniref:Uncharacterized protein n=1 Tax=Vitis vinifera TaxID=29760 RepID=F6H5F8_VITVI